MIEVLVQNDPYRYIKMPDPLENGQPDYRIQKWNNHKKVDSILIVLLTNIIIKSIIRVLKDFYYD